jgi:hypothetical protein
LKRGDEMKKLLTLTLMLLLLASFVIPVIAEDLEIDDPFTYTPATYSATVAPSGSTSVSVSLGLSSGGVTLTYPVTTTGWGSTSGLPSGWTVTPSGSTTFSWASGSATVSDTLTVSVPSGAAADTYTFTAFLSPGKDSDTSHPNPHTVGAGNGIVFTITVPAASTDTTPPVITPIVTGALGNNGWYVGDVTVTWSVVDDESTVSSTSGCGLTTISSDTTGTTLTCSATSAGGMSSQSVTIKRDATAPTVSFDTCPGDVLLNEPVSLGWTASDATSGIDGATSGTKTVDTSTVGSHSVSITVYDLAGNSGLDTCTVNVIYKCTSFLQPIDAGGRSIFKFGSTVPIKFQCTDYYNVYIPTIVANLKTAFIDDDVAGSDIEAVSTAAATTGSLFRYDPTSNQYIFNLNTKKLDKGTWQLKAILDSGQNIIEVISLK